MGNYFKGYYYKHRYKDNIISIINSESNDGKIIQILTKNNSYTVPYNKDNLFSNKGIRINVNSPNISLSGQVSYTNLTPIKYDIMGPFKFIPMECKHEIVSMNHKIHGGFTLNGKYLDFTGGTGYIEGDSGRSFPKGYMWVQCNDIEKNYSIVASIAEIPLGIINFKGCICNIHYMDKEYRLATYLGAKIVRYNKNELVIRQRNYELKISISNFNGHKLNAPRNGMMDRTIYEDISCVAEYKFIVNKKIIFNIYNKQTSFEFSF